MKPIDRLRAKVVPRCTVVRSREPLGERLVVLTADQPMPVMLAPGDVIAVRITSKGFGPTGTWRRYTVSSSTAATFEIIAFRTQTGPATPFLDSLTVGASLVVRGPEAPVPPPRQRRVCWPSSATRAPSVRCGRWHRPAAHVSPRVST